MILLDEPTRGMDPEGAAALVALLRRRAAEGAAVLVATHDPGFAAAVADRRLMLADGAVRSRPRPPAPGGGRVSPSATVVVVLTLLLALGVLALERGGGGGRRSSRWSRPWARRRRPAGCCSRRSRGSSRSRSRAS